MSESMIEAVHVTKSFRLGEKTIPVLKDIDLTIEKGEFVSLMGPSGSGKSTLLYILGGLDYADSGSVRVCGEEIGSQSDQQESKMRQKRLGFVFQAYNLIDNLTVEENVLLPAQLAGKKNKGTIHRTQELLKAVGLYEQRGHRPGELSGGQQQRTAIARALMNQPDVIFADEPIGNLDSKNGKEILELLQKLNREYGITILMVTHSSGSTRYGNRVIHLADGQIIS